METTTVNNGETNASINISPLPLEYLQNFDNIFSLGGQEFSLNNSGTKRLAIGVTSREVPELKIVFKLHDTKNGCFIQFPKKTWDAIIYHSNIITNYLEAGTLDQIVADHRLRISIQQMYNRFCVTFTDRSEINIVMMPETFNTLICLKDEVQHAYAEMHIKVKDVSTRMKLFMDVTFFHLFKSNNIDARHNYNWLSIFMNKSSDFLSLSHSIANTWQELGKWDGTQQTEESTDQPQ